MDTYWYKMKDNNTVLLSTFPIAGYKTIKADSVDEALDLIGKTLKANSVKDIVEKKDVLETTNVSTYQWEQMVRRLAKPGVEILRELTDSRIDLLHAAVGICGEAGELLDAIKKHVIYNKPINLENIIEELGDLEFYLEQLRSNTGVLITREHTLKANYAKLSKRYSSGTYSDSQAQTRADKQEEHKDG